jgi:hypothetical protein
MLDICYADDILDPNFTCPIEHSNIRTQVWRCKGVTQGPSTALLARSSQMQLAASTCKMFHISSDDSGGTYAASRQSLLPSSGR